MHVTLKVGTPKMASRRHGGSSVQTNNMLSREFACVWHYHSVICDLHVYFWGEHSFTRKIGM